MKVNVITRHAIANYGSILQSFATIKIIEKLGYEAEIIDYIREEENTHNLIKTYTKNSQMWNKNFLTRFIYRAVQKPNLDRMNKKFELYRNNYLKLTPKQYRNENELQSNLPSGEIFCTGSDQVWGQIANEDYDKNYFLSFVPDEKKCIAYSASFGKSQISEELKKDLPQLLKKYKRICVREDSAVKLLNEVGIEDVKLVLDPTLLLSQKEWDDLLKIKDEKTKTQDKYILIYQLHHNPKFDEYAKKIKKETGLKIIRISPSIYFKFKIGQLEYLPTLERFMELFKNAEYVLTDSFHGTVFSIIYNRKMIDILPGKTGTRIRSILSLFGIEDRIVCDYSDMSILKKKLDFVKINEVLKKQREESIKLLNEILEV